ncbi:MAG: nitrogen regulation protein NR(II) [Myxococcota bacterium]
MPVSIQSAVVGTLVTFAVMASVVLRRRHRRSDRVFGVACVFLALWFIAGLVGELGAGRWSRSELAASALLPPALARLFEELVPGTRLRSRRLRRLVLPIGLILAGISLSTLADLPMVRAAIGAAVLISILWASRSLLQATSTETPVERVRRRYVAFGASSVALVCTLTALPWIPETTKVIGHTSVMVYVFFLSQVILRERLLDLNEFIARMSVLGALALLFATVSALLIGISATPSGRLFNTVVGIMIALTLYEPLRDRMERKVFELFFRERFRFVQMVQDLRNRMQRSILDARSMSRRLVDELYNSRRATHVAAYLLDPDERGFTLAAHRGPEPALHVNPQELPELYQAIYQHPGTLIAESLSPQWQGNDESKALMEAMRQANADALFAFQSEDAIMGFLALRDDRSPEAYASTELRELQGLADTAATVLWNSKLAESVREKERLAALGAMAAGLAHEIRNPLGAIKGAAEVLDTDRSGLEGELLTVIVEETRRLNGVVSQFLDYARPYRATLRTVDINDVVRSTVRLLEVEEHNRGRLELELESESATVEADPEQLKQVVLNLLLNALEASQPSDEPPRITVQTRLRPQRDGVELRVRDRGIGIKSEDLERIFIPFFTTKHSGTGLGLAMCQRIVQAHGGSISAASVLNEGTEFVVRLPFNRRNGDAAARG